MKKIINLIIFLVAYCNYAQTNKQSFDFEFYANGRFRNSKNVKIQLVKNLDTVKCEISNGRITIPEKPNQYSVIVEVKNKKYIVNNVDFSKLDSESKFILGIEDNIKNFEPISNENKDIYIIPNTMTPVKIEHLEQASEVVFVVFTSDGSIENNLKKVKSYSRYSLIKKE